MEGQTVKIRRRLRRRKGLRKRLFGTAERPRLSVFRSHKNIYAQIIDDDRGVTLCEASTRSKELAPGLPYGGNVVAAKRVGEFLGRRAKEQNIERVCFDRGGFRYHGRVKALADAVREAGLKF